jgi:lysophospholipase L1-like esterase
MERNGGQEEIFTFGHYLRIYIRQAKAAGAIPIVLSPTPGNRWTNGKINRMTETYTKWAKEVARQEGVEFIDLNKRVADKYDAMGEDKGKLLFVDSAHTTYDGAIMNARSVIEGLQSLNGFSLNQYIK